MTFLSHRLSNFLVTTLFVSVLFYSHTSQAEELTEGQICQAAISTIMNRDVEDVRLDRDKKQLKHLSFINFEDEVKWQFKCYVEDNKIIWATQMGSWRNTLLDSVVNYSVQEDVLTISEKHTNGSVFKKAFSIKKLPQNTAKKK